MKITKTPTTPERAFSPKLKPFNPKPFNPPFWLTGAHPQTIIPRFTMPKPPPYRRELVKDSLNESDIAYDFLDAGEPAPAQGQKYQKPLIVMFHGMEGSSTSHYARTLAYYVHSQDWHFVVAHFRSCGGVPSKGKIFYDAGDSDEVHHVLGQLTQRYATVHAIGTSLGGNVLTKYLGEYGDDALCASAIAVSAPLDLASSSIAMKRFLGRKVYTPYLLNPIVNKALQQNLSDEEIRLLKASRSICEFDQIFTAPRHGYRSKNDYYRKASALPHLHKITVPTLILTAQDDPFLGIVPTQGDVSDTVTLLEPKHGGHIGFVNFDWHSKRFNVDWYTHTVMDYFKSIA